MLGENSSYKIYFKKLPDINHLQIFRFTVYIFIYKEKQIIKLEKFEAWALKDILVGYNRHAIYKIFIWSQNKVIQVKNLWIFKDISEKITTILPDFEKKPMFEDFFIIN